MADNAPASVAIKRVDYKEPAHWTRHVELNVSIVPGERTRISSVLTIETNAAQEKGQPLVFDGDKGHQLEKVVVNGTALAEGPDGYQIHAAGTEDTKLEIAPAALAAAGDKFTVELTMTADVENNKTCMGLYLSKTEALDGSQKPLYSTQMEAEGMRKMTYFQDRPDVMSTYKVRIEAPKEGFPVLLGNGNLVQSGDAEGARHFAVYEDPFPKPCYLFAVVAGELAHVEDKFTTRSGRKVTVRVYCEPKNHDKLEWALQSTLDSMKFDEDYFNLEYDLDIFNIVSVRDFNMGAMENKSLNIFNEALILAAPATANDDDYERIANVIAHEYFHNWTGNRVTCRDWFQLTLKEGLTVYRDQTFANTVGLKGKTKRLEDVKLITGSQFGEDAGPLAHPVRPDEYEKIDNFYTLTVYYKGAEVVRMYETILGIEGFRKGLALYFKRHDGTAVTCDDFLAAMQDANDVDLSLFSKWYSTKGTPEVQASAKWDAAAGTYTMKFVQGAKAAKSKDPVTEVLHIPIKYGLLDRATGRELVPGGVYHLKQEEDSLVIDGLPKDAQPVPSLLRGFSAPVKLYFDQYTLEDFAALGASDTDSYGKFNALRKVYEDAIFSHYEALQAGKKETPSFPLVVAAVEKLLRNESGDSFLGIANTLGMPTTEALMQSYTTPPVDYHNLDAAREAVRTAVTVALKDTFEKLADSLPEFPGTERTQEAIGARKLRSALLMLLEDADRAHALWKKSDDMTSREAAFAVLVKAGKDKETGVNEEFFKFAKQHGFLVMDKWFRAQALHAKTMDQVRALVEHPEFVENVENPNRLRSVLAAFAMGNGSLLHTEAGYGFIADWVKKVNGKGNTQMAARFARSLSGGTKLTDKYQGLIKATVEDLVKPEHGLKEEPIEICNSILKGLK